MLEHLKPGKWGCNLIIGLKIQISRPNQQFATAELPLTNQSLCTNKTPNRHFPLLSEVNITYGLLNPYFLYRLFESYLLLL